MIKIRTKGDFFWEELFEKLKISPKNLTFIIQLLSHSSYANEHKAKKRL